MVLAGATRVLRYVCVCVCVCVLCTLNPREFPTRGGAGREGRDVEKGQPGRQCYTCRGLPSVTARRAHTATTCTHAWAAWHRVVHLKTQASAENPGGWTC